MSFAMKTDANITIDMESTAGILSWLDPDLMMKMSVVMGGLFGLATNVAPRFIGSLFCSSTKEAREQLNYRAVSLCSYVGAGELSSALIFYCLIWEQTTIFTAIQVSYAFWVYYQTRFIAEAPLLDPSCLCLAVVIFAFMAHAMTWEQQAATIAIQVAAAFWIAQGLAFALAPELASKLWRFDLKKSENGGDEWTPLAITMTRYLGFWLTANTAGHICLASASGTVRQAMVCWHLGHGGWLLTGLLGGELQEASVLVGPAVFWIPYHTAVIYALLMN